MPSNRCWLADDSGAGSARKVSGLTTRRCAARGGERSLSLAFAFSWWPVRHAPRRQRAATCARASHQVSARFRPQPGRTRQLSDRSTSLPRTAARTLSFRSDGRKLARPDETGRVPKMAARLRPASSRLRREAAPVAEDQELAPRGFARCKPPALSVRSVISAPPPFRRLHCGGQKPPNSLRKPI